MDMCTGANMLGCLFCKRKKKLFKIYLIYGTTGCPIKDYIVQFLGPIDNHLTEDQGMCRTCIFVLDNLLSIKNSMCDAIVSDSNNEDIRFTHVFSIFCSNLQKVKYVESIPRQPHRTDTPHADREVRDVLSREKPNQPRERLVKSSLSQPAKSPLSVYSEPVSRKRRHQRALTDDVRNELRYDKEGRILNKRTRAISRIQEKIAAVLDECVYKCIDGCREQYSDLAKLTQHKIDEHKLLAKYWCYECYMTRFTSQNDLDKHNNIAHKILITNCLLCSQELQNREELQKHLDEHRIHSVPCNYCDKYFLNGRSCEAHIQECHKGRKKRIKIIRPQTILDRIDKEADIQNNTVTDQSESNNEHFVKILIQSIPAKEDCNFNQMNTDGPNSNERHNLSDVCGDTEKQQEPPTTGDAVISGEDRSTNEIDDCENENNAEIYVTAVEETFIAEIQEISTSHPENQCVQHETSSVEGDCSTEEFYPVINSTALEDSDHLNKFTSESNSEAIERSREEILPVTQSTHENSEPAQSQNRCEIIEYFGEENSEEGHYIDHISEICHEEVIIDYQETITTKEHDIDNETRPSSGNEVVQCSIDIALENPQQTKSSPQEINLIEHRKITDEVSYSGPDNKRKPQLKVVLETIRIGSDFLEKLPLKCGQVIKNDVASTSNIKKQTVKGHVKRKKLKNTSVLTQTPILNRKCNSKTGGVFREKKYLLTNKRLSLQNSKHSGDSVTDTLGIYDFKDDDDTNKIAHKNLPKTLIKKKANKIVKGQEKVFKSYAPHKLKSKGSPKYKNESKSYYKRFLKDKVQTVRCHNVESGTTSSSTSGDEIEYSPGKSKTSSSVNKKTIKVKSDKDNANVKHKIKSKTKILKGKSERKFNGSST